jgi:hypothetical protein
MERRVMSDQFPRGKLNDSDEGELQMKIGVRDRTVILDFGKPVVWLGLDYHTAMNLAANITKRAAEIKPKS